MGKKSKKPRSQPKLKAAARLAAQNDHPKTSPIAPAARNTQTSQLQSDEALKREPTEAEVMAIMHDDDLLEYHSSGGSALRKKSIFEFYNQQWKALRAAEERVIKRRRCATRSIPRLSRLYQKPKSKERVVS